MGPSREPRDGKPRDGGRFNETETVDISGGIGADAPEAEDHDWESLEGAPLAPDSVPLDGDIGTEGRIESGTEAGGDLPEEDDDNPDQESDEALPDDEEEHAIRRDMAGQGIRYKPE
jgi:hypothetical protein